MSLIFTFKQHFDDISVIFKLRGGTQVVLTMYVRNNLSCITNNFWFQISLLGKLSDLLKLWWSISKNGNVPVGDYMNQVHQSLGQTESFSFLSLKRRHKHIQNISLLHYVYYPLYPFGYLPYRLLQGSHSRNRKIILHGKLLDVFSLLDTECSVSYDIFSVYLPKLHDKCI